jgi:flap endonuclease-1
MGISGLTKLIYKHAPDAITKKKFGEFQGQTIGIDASLIIYQIVIAMRNMGCDLTNTSGEITSHLYGLFYKIIKFTENGITPIFVFDGRAPSIKNVTIGKRKLQRDTATAKLAEPVDPLNPNNKEDRVKCFKKTYSISRKEIREAQILLDLMGVPYIVAPGEADIVLAYLASNGFVDGVCSDDSDILVFGSTNIYKDMSRYMNKNKDISVVSLKKVLKGLKIDMSKFIDMCVLLGCDYCEPIKKIGVARAYELVRRYDSLNEILSKIKKKNPDTEIDVECMLKARDYFRDAHNEIKGDLIKPEELTMAQIQEDALIDFMHCKHGFDLLKIRNAVSKLKNLYKKMKVGRVNARTDVHKIIQPKCDMYLFSEEA